jgi:hypothetical protein
MVSVVVEAAASLLPVVAFVTAVLVTAVDVTVPLIVMLLMIASVKVELMISAPSRNGSWNATPTDFVFVAIIFSLKTGAETPVQFRSEMPNTLHHLS